MVKPPSQLYPSGGAASRRAGPCAVAHRDVRPRQGRHRACCRNGKGVRHPGRRHVELQYVVGHGANEPARRLRRVTLADVGLHSLSRLRRSTAPYNSSMPDTITPAVQDYLKAIHSLGGAEQMVTPVDIASRLKVKAPSVTGMLKRLESAGLVTAEFMKTTRWQPRAEGFVFTGCGRQSIAPRPRRVPWPGLRCRRSSHSWRRRLDRKRQSPPRCGATRSLWPGRDEAPPRGGRRPGRRLPARPRRGRSGPGPPRCDGGPEGAVPGADPLGIGHHGGRRLHQVLLDAFRLRTSSGHADRRSIRPRCADASGDCRREAGVRKAGRAIGHAIAFRLSETSTRSDDRGGPPCR